MQKTIINFSNLFLGRFFLGLFVIFSFAFLPVIFAENLAVSSAKAAGGNFAVVNLKNIVGKAKASKDIERQLKKMREVFEKEVASTEKSLKKDNQKLQEQKDETSQKIFDLKLKEFQLRLKDAGEEIQKKKVRLERAYIGALGKVKDETLAIIKEISEREGYDMVFLSGDLLYASDKLDISAEVLEKLDERLPSFKLDVKNN